MDHLLTGAQLPLAGFSIRELGAGLAIVDVLVIVFGVGYTIFAALSWGSTAEEEGDNEPAPTNGAAAQAIGSMIAVAATGSSVLMGASGVVLGLGGGDHPIADRAFSQLTVTAVVLAVSLVFGALSASYALTHIHHPKSVAENTYVLACATAQLVSLVVGAIFFAVSLFLL